MVYILLTVLFAGITFLLYKRLTAPERKKGSGGSPAYEDRIKEDGRKDHLQGE